MAIKFKEMIEPPTGNNLLVVDAMNLAFRWKHQGKLQFIDDYIRTVESLAKSYKCGKVIIAADWGSSSYRKNLYPDYKQNRKDLADAQTPEEKEAFELFFREYERLLSAFGPYPVLRFKGVEADDIAAYLCKSVDVVEHIWLISSDRDWDLMIGEGVSRFSYVTRKETTIDSWPYEVTPEDYISYKALVGDTGDNIQGIPGVGPKRAASLIKMYGSALDIYDLCPINSKYKYIQALNEHKERIILNLNLMDLISFCEEAIGPENLSSIDQVVAEYLINDSNQLRT